MHGVMSEKKNQDERKSLDFQINKGVELMLRNKTKMEEKPKTFQIKFGKMVSFLRREFHIFLNFSFDVRKTKK
jgi:hypothetical protein